LSCCREELPRPAAAGYTELVAHVAPAASAADTGTGLIAGSISLGSHDGDSSGPARPWDRWRRPAAIRPFPQAGAPLRLTRLTADSDWWPAWLRAIGLETGNRKCDGGLQLRHRRRWNGRLRAGQPALRGPGQPAARAGVTPPCYEPPALCPGG